MIRATAGWRFSGISTLPRLEDYLRGRNPGGDAFERLKPMGLRALQRRIGRNRCLSAAQRSESLSVPTSVLLAVPL